MATLLCIKPTGAATTVLTKTKSKEIQMEDLFPILIIGWIVSAWMTHIVVCLQTAAWGFLIAGAIVFPIAWVHGTGIWLGIF
jgi:hypothetical protein